MTGRRINSLNDLAYMAERKKAVVVPKSHAWRKPRPAAFMIHLPGVCILRLFDAGMYKYIKTDDIVIE